MALLYYHSVYVPIPTQLVHMKKAQVLNTRLCQEQLQESCPATDLLDLINTLNEITVNSFLNSLTASVFFNQCIIHFLQDVDFTCNLVLSSPYQSYTTLRDLLFYAKNKASGKENVQQVH